MGDEQAVRRCRCGHVEEAHEHFRRGSDCGECGAAVCPRFRPDDGAPA